MSHKCKATTNRPYFDGLYHPKKNVNFGMDPVGPLGSLAHFVEGQLTHLAAVPTVLPGKNTMRNACFFCKPGEPGVLQFFETMNTQIQV